MLELIFVVILIVGGVVYATFATNPMHFDDLFELRFLPSRRRVMPTRESLGLNPDDHSGLCARKGQVNSPFSNHICDCTGWKYKQDFFGMRICECGDEVQVHGRKVNDHEARNQERG